MKDWNPIWMLALFIAVCFLAAGAGAVFTSSSVSNWYPTLRKPSWNPPAWIFGPVWTALYLMMAIAAWLVWRSRGFHDGAGALIDYRLRLHGVLLRWQSEITAWEPPHRFVDEQRRGPYRAWIHEHTFTENKGGSEARDFVRYAAPGGWLVDRLFVRHDVRRIFEYRTRKLQELFV